MHVLVIYTGGTIGMVPSDKGLLPDSALSQQLTADAIPEKMHLHWLVWPELIDSSNVQPEHWSKLAQDIYDHRTHYDAFLVLHGTDTLAFTASSLAWQLRGFKKPIVLTGSQLPFCATGSDAPANWQGALQMLRQPSLQEVSIFFDGQLLRATRSTKIDNHSFSAFESPRYPVLGHSNPARLHPEHCLMPQTEALQPTCYTEQPVNVIHWVPGLSGDTLTLLPEGCRAVILILFGSGTGPHENLAFQQALAKLQERQILVLGVSSCPYGNAPPDTYASGHQLLELGVLPAFDYTLEAAYTKVLHLCHRHPSATSLELKQLFQENWAGEQTSA